MADRTIELHDGRKLGLQGRGDPVSGRVVVFCHPAPGAAGFDPDPTVTANWGVHVLSVDRPGYGASTPLAPETAPTVADRADDIAEYIMNARSEASVTGQPLPQRKVGVIGWSAGGRIALVLAARYPRLVDRVAVVATPAPDSAIEWVPDEYQAALERFAAMPPAQGRRELEAMLAPTIPRGAPDLGAVGIGEADAETLDRPGMRDRLTHMLHGAYTQGPAGMAADLLSYATDEWADDLHDVRADVHLYYGGDDHTVPAAHGRWYRHALRRAEHAKLTVVPRRGHLVVADAWEQILEHVAPREARTAR